MPRRFDNALMSPPAADAEVASALLTPLRAWCEGGAFPTMTEPLRVISTAPQSGLDSAACALDGSHELTRKGRLPGLIWRLKILSRELVETAGAQPGIPWDCGWWRGGSLDPARGFRPRRATLLMVREIDRAVVDSLIAVLAANSASFTKPVRVVVVSPGPIAGMARL